MAKDARQATVISDTNSAAIVTLSAPQSQLATNYITGIILSASGAIAAPVAATLTDINGTGSLAFNLPAGTMPPFIQMFGTHPLEVIAGQDATLTLPALGTGIVGTATVLYFPSSASASNASATTVVDALLQPFVNGDYDDGYFDVFGTSSGFPVPGSDTLLATTRLDTPAVASTVSGTEIILAFTNDTPTILADSDFTVYKYFRVTKSDHTSGALYGSIGLSTDDFDPFLIVDTMSWSSGNTLSLNGVVHVQSIAETLTGFDVTLTPTSPTPFSGTGYTAAAQAKAGGSNLNRIIAVTPSNVKVSGTGGGSVTESSVFTNRYGLTAAIHATAGTYPTTEKIHVTDGTFTGDSANVVVSNVAWTVVASASAPGAGASAVTAGPIDTTGADLIVIVRPDYTGATMSDSVGNTYVIAEHADDTPGCYIYYKQNPTTSATHTFSEDGIFDGLVVFALSGSVASPLDQISVAQGSGSSGSPGSVTPLSDNEIVVVGVASNNNSVAPSISAGFSNLIAYAGITDTSFQFAAAIQIQTSATAVNPTFSNLSGAWTAVTATFKGIGS